MLTVLELLRLNKDHVISIEEKPQIPNHNSGDRVLSL